MFLFKLIFLRILQQVTRNPDAYHSSEIRHIPMADKPTLSKQVNIKNKKASFEYQFLDTYVAGLVLTGTEIKSIRMGTANLQEAYCVFINNELFVKSMHISKYNEGSYYNHEPLKDRKLLLQ